MGYGNKIFQAACQELERRKRQAEELADRLHHDKMLLDMLFDLTRADGSSLGATAGETITKQYGWSKWREQIVRGMYSAARAAM